MQRAITAQAGRLLIERMLAGEHDWEKLKEAEGSRTLRLHIEPGHSVIVKLWLRPGLPGRIRRLTRTHPPSRESRALERLLAAGIPVPAPLGASFLAIGGFPFTDAFFLEDLGVCETAFEHLKALLRADRERDATRFLDEVVEITARIVEAGLIDTDHSLNNLVVTQQGRLFRLDTELARPHRGRPARPYGIMLGRLVGTLAFAVQPEVERVAPFASALKRRLAPDAATLREAHAQVERMLETQRRQRGRHTELLLPW